MISLIVLASGYGKRFGSNKLFTDIDGKEMYLHILAKLCNIKEEAAEIILVSQYEEILNTAKKLGITAVRNDRADEGISASIKAGLNAAKGSSWYFFFTADQPYINEDSIKGFIENVTKSGFLLGSVYSEGIPGSPTAFNVRYRDKLLALTGDMGGRKIINSNPSDVFWYEISKKEITDIDYKKDKF